MSTESVHAEIEQLAAWLLDSIPKTDTPSQELMDIIETENRHAHVLDQIGQRQTDLGNPSTSIRLSRGPHLAMFSATITHLLLADSRGPIRYCDHRTELYNDELTMFSAPLRYVGCSDCAPAYLEYHESILALDSSCDICAEQSEIATPRTVLQGGLVVHFYTGPCCDGLIDYADPVSAVPYIKSEESE